MNNCYNPYQEPGSNLAVITIIPESLMQVDFYLSDRNAESHSFSLEFYTKFKVASGVLIDALIPATIEYGEFLLPNSELKMATKISFAQPIGITFGALPYRDVTDQTLIPGSNCGVFHFIQDPATVASELLVFGYAVLMKV